MKLINRAGMAAIALILIAFPFYRWYVYPRLTLYYAHEFAALFDGRNLRDYFDQRLREEARAGKLTVDHLGHTAPAMARADVRKFFTRQYGANFQPMLNPGLIYPEDLFSWKTPTMIYSVTVDYRELPDGVYFLDETPHSTMVNPFFDRTRWEPVYLPAIFWAATWLVLGFRVRAFVMARPGLMRRLEFVRRPLAPLALMPSPRSRRIESIWKRGRFVLVLIVAALVAYGGFLSYSYYERQKCRSARARLYNALTWYNLYFNERPRAEDLVAHFSEYKERFMEECGKAVEQRCHTGEKKADEWCVKYWCNFPASLDEITCPQGGAYRSGYSKEILCSKHKD